MRDDDYHTEDQWRWHMQAIKNTLARWEAGDITTFQKRREIADENQRYYANAAEPWMTRTGKRYEAPSVIADAVGVDEDTMTVALNVFRESGREAYERVILSALGRSL